MVRQSFRLTHRAAKLASMVKHANASAFQSAERNSSLLKGMWVVFGLLVFALAFIRLGSEIGEGETTQFDTTILIYAQSYRGYHTWVAEVMRDLSGIGSTVSLTLITVLTVAYLAIFRKKRLALLVASAVLSGTLLVSVFKANFGRARPDAKYAEFLVSGWSFPSGHASMSAIVFLTLGTLIASTRANRFERAFIIAAAATLAGLVGLSRIALGVHYATDVLGGWAFGTSWAIAWLLVANWVSSDSTME